MRRFALSLSLLFVAAAANAAVPVNGTPSRAARAKSSFATTFYTMRWDSPDVLDYRYDRTRGELRLDVRHNGSGAENASLTLAVKADKPGRYPMPASGSGSFDVIGCENSIVPGKSHVEITRMDAGRIEGRFHLQGHCAEMASNSETLRDGRFSLVFDPPAK
jgi:hypothetical protein